MCVINYESYMQPIQTYQMKNSTNNKVKVPNTKPKIKHKNASHKSLSIDDIDELLNIHIDYINDLKTFSAKTKCKMRQPNFPECISENIIKEYINIIEKRNCIKSTSGGDLQVAGIKIEVKCFTSQGPTSFGPKEKWDELYFLDATNFINKKIKIYKLSMSNDSAKFGSLKINSNKTFKDICKEGKRPRIRFEELKKQLSNDVVILYDGDINFRSKST